MHEEQLFEMVNDAVNFAKNELETKQDLSPFAMVLYDSGNAESITNDQFDHSENYDALVAALRKRVAKEPAISGLAILAKVNIPAQYKPPVNDGIRIHLEERHRADEKIGARFLYVPYQLYRDNETGEVATHLHDPIAVGFPAEIFTK